MRQEPCSTAISAVKSGRVIIGAEEANLRQRLTAVIFDMDGLMLDTERMARVAWNRAMKDWGLTIPDPIYQKLIGRTLLDVKHILLQEVDGSLPFDKIADRKDKYLEEEVALNGISVKPGLYELVEWLESRGVPRAVASSTFREKVIKKLQLARLAERFDVIVSGDETQNGKPAPDIFLAAADKLGVAAVRCVVLEDSEPGIQAAHAAGMTAVLVPDQQSISDRAAKLAEQVLPSLHEVKVYLQAAMA
jgi:HAD superfamily hydrolase (TIGR01509 family)